MAQAIINNFLSRIHQIDAENDKKKKVDHIYDDWVSVWQYSYI